MTNDTQARARDVIAQYLWKLLKGGYEYRLEEQSVADGDAVLTALEAAEQEGVFRVWRYEDGVVNPAPVQVGRVTQDGALVLGGVKEGDMIVTSGLSRLRPGQVVNIQIKDQGQ